MGLEHEPNIHIYRYVHIDELGSKPKRKGVIELKLCIYQQIRKNDDSTY